MIRLYGPERTPEHEVAETIAERIRSAWPNAEGDPNCDVRLIAGAKCYGERHQDVDVLMFARMLTPIPLSLKHEIEVRIAGICVAIEVKDHPPERVRFEGNQAYVEYRGEWHAASEQSFGQR